MIWQESQVFTRLIIFPANLEIVVNRILIVPQMNLDDFVTDGLDVIKIITARQRLQHLGKFYYLVHDFPFREFIQGRVRTSKAFDTVELNSVSVVVDTQMASAKLLAPKV